MNLLSLYQQFFFLSLSLLTWSKSQRQNLDNMQTTLVRGDSSDIKCYDSGIGWKTLGTQKEDYEEVSCPDGTCVGTWTAEPGKLYYIK